MVKSRVAAFPGLCRRNTNVLLVRLAGIRWKQLPQTCTQRRSALQVQLFKLSEKQLIEGTLDLAFVENGKWIIVDSKIDLTTTTQPHYVRQVEWYVYDLSQLTKTEAEGWLSGV